MNFRLPVELWTGIFSWQIKTHPNRFRVNAIHENCLYTGTCFICACVCAYTYLAYTSLTTMHTYVYTIYKPMQNYTMHGGLRIRLSFTIENVLLFFLIRFIYYSLCFVLLSLAQQIGIDKKGKRMWCL